MIKSKQKSTKNSVCGVKISHPDKIVYADCSVTKYQIAQYYNLAGRRMLKYVKHRLISAVRCFGGLNCFYKKHPSTIASGISSMQVKDKSKLTQYFYINSKKGIINEVQLGTIEFHCWASQVETLNKPDIMVFDLDPDTNLSLTELRKGVRDLKNFLDDLNLKSFLKTSGGKGYHIVVPFKPNASWEKFSKFAKNVAMALEQKYPDRYTSNIRKASRKGKIFIDWERNTYAQTSVAPYSLRARLGAKISMPISWRDLNKIAPNDVNIFSAIEMLKKPDPWKNFFKVNQTIN